MSEDQINSGPSHHDSEDESGADGPLLTQLRAFGVTLSAATETRITPDPEQPVSTNSSQSADGVPDTQSADGVPGTRPDRRSRYLLAVAAVTIAMGVGLLSVWSSNGDDPTDPLSTVSVAGENVETDADRNSDTESDRDVAPAPGSEEDQPAVQPNPPSIIAGSDGSALATVDDSSLLLEPDAEPWGPLYQPSFESLNTFVAADRDVEITRAVVDELIELDLPGVGGERDRVVDALITGGLRVTTTIDPHAMDLVGRAVGELVPESSRDGELGLITIDNRTGAIIAVGSTAPTAPVMTEWELTPGSAFKPIVLAALFEQGYEPGDMVDHSGPCSFATDSSTYTVAGSSSLISSIASVTWSSNNCAFVRLGLAAGLDQVVERAEMVGLTQPEGAESLPLLSLGKTTARGVDLAGAYASFANDGQYRKPWLIQEVVDFDGRSIYRSNPAGSESQQVMSTKTARMITEVLAGNVVRGTGVRAALEDHEAAGKTGTTENFANAWFVGYTNSYTTAVWVGDPTEIRVPGYQKFGGGLPALVWGAYNTELNRGIDPVPFQLPPQPTRDGAILIERPESELDVPDQPGDDD